MYPTEQEFRLAEHRFHEMTENLLQIGHNSRRYTDMQTSHEDKDGFASLLWPGNETRGSQLLRS